MTGSDIAPIWRIWGGSARSRIRQGSAGEMRMSVLEPGAAPEPRAAFDRISLRRLVLIRWVAIAGQAVTLLTVHYSLGFHLPLVPALGIVACSVALNLS